jgi:hypothetical protein
LYAQGEKRIRRKDFGQTHQQISNAGPAQSWMEEIKMSERTKFRLGFALALAICTALLILSLKYHFP